MDPKCSHEGINYLAARRDDSPNPVSKMEKIVKTSGE